MTAIAKPPPENTTTTLAELFKTAHLNPQAALLMKVLDNIYECVLVIDTNTTIVYVNSAYSQILGVPRHKIIGKTLSRLEPCARVLEVLKTGKAIINDASHIHSLGIDVVANMCPLYHQNELIGAVAIFRNTTEIAKLTRELERFKSLTRSLQAKLHQRTRLPEPFSKIVGINSHFVKILEVAAQVAATDTPVLIQGESGVGKEVLARAIHESSPRAQGPFIKINCAAIPEQLLESELFGYEEGAFTGARRGGKRGKFEVANKGTLLLDEIGDMSLTMQAKLLRVLQEKEFERLGGNRPIKVDVRIIAATNRNLQELVLNKQFRQDLYYRINVMPITIPPLRERKDDIGLLTTHYLEKLGEKYGRVLTCSPDTMDIFYSYSWPGNIRELQNVLEHAAIMCPDNLIMPQHLPAYLYNHLPATFLQKQSSINLKNLLAELEEKAIRSALEITKNNKTKAMTLLGLSRRAFYQKLRKYNIQA